MVIFERPFAKLEYDTGLHLLKVTYGDRKGYQLADLAELMRHVGEHALTYGVKRLLLDFSKSLNPMQDSEVEAASRHIAEICHAARIERVARVASPSLLSESKVREGIDRVNQQEPFRFKLRTFLTKTEAIRWLTQS